MNTRSRELQKINAFSMKGIILFEKIPLELQRAQLSKQSPSGRGCWSDGAIKRPLHLASGCCIINGYHAAF